MTEISATPAVVTPIAGTLGATHSTTTNDELGQDAFLQLMVAQLRYQDPSSPVDSASFLAQTAQFTSVQKLQELVSAQSAASAVQQRLSAASIVGQQVSWTAEDGTSKTGVAEAVRLVPGAEPQVQVGTDAVPLSSLSEIRRSSGASAPAGS